MHKGQRYEEMQSWDSPQQINWQKIKLYIHQHSCRKMTDSATRWAQCTRSSVLAINGKSTSQAGKSELGKYSTQTEHKYHIHTHVCTHLYTYKSFPMGVIICLSE